MCSLIALTNLCLEWYFMDMITFGNNFGIKHDFIKIYKIVLLIVP